MADGQKDVSLLAFDGFAKIVTFNSALPDPKYSLSLRQNMYLWIFLL